ncbi:MAG: hypothetical protein HGB26_01715 [Desulfobulbaceae bacterium]|nr:hypothetical protein [Desulfobulbaceae bacterium]
MVNKEESFGTAGGIRPMVARWIITGEMILETAAHFGGEGEGMADMKILHDLSDGSPLLPGTSLAGALRSHLADVLGGYRSAEHGDVPKLFGASRKNEDEGTQSPLIVFDSLGKVPEEKKIEIRDGVAINPETGTAKSHMKFDIEVLPAGTVFPVRIELIVEKIAEEADLLGLLTKAVSGLSNGDISLGMRRSRGLGAVNVRNWKAKRFDLPNRDGWVCWLTSDHVHPIVNEIPYDLPVDAVQSAYPALRLEEPPDDKRERMVIELQLQLAGDLLVRSSGYDPAAPDAVHLYSAGKPVLPGTSLAGVMRSQALRIARCVRESQGDGDEWINRLFGPQIEKRQGSDSQKPSASRLRVSENFFTNRDARRQTRIAIDRFTGGVVQGALFDEQVHAGGQLTIRLELRDPTDAETGLLLLLLKDFLSGEIPVGGSASVGRGVFRGTAKLFLNKGIQYDIGPDLQVQKDVMDDFNLYIKNFREYPLSTKEVPA